MKRLVVDLDGTLTVEPLGEGLSYTDAIPNLAMIAQLRIYKRKGFEIVVFTARNMRTYQGALGKINVHTLPVILEWLKRHDVPFDEVVVGKPWCGTDGFYVDDRAVRPNEFLALSLEDLQLLIRK
jgi:capsule biosynthesis phosphatase